MTTGNSPEQSNGNPSQENLAAQAAQEIISRIRAVDASGVSNQEQNQQKSELALDTLREYQRSQEILKRLIEAEKSGGSSEPQQEKIQKTQQNLGLSLIKACTLADNDISVVQNPKANRILRELSKTTLNVAEAVAIQEAVGDYLLGGRAGNIIISKPGEIRSDFMKSIDNLIETNLYAADKLLRSLVMRATDFGMTPDEIVKSFRPETPEDDMGPLNTQENQGNLSKDSTINAEMLEAGLGNDIFYYRSKFTEKQLELVKTFYSPTAFIEYMNELGKQASDGTKDPRKVLEEKDEIRKHIKDRYEKSPPILKDGESLEEKIEIELERHWGEKVSSRMKGQVSELLDHLFLVLQLKSPHKFHDQVMQEADMLYGPVPTFNKIQSAINRLMSTTAELERKNNPEDPLSRKIKKIRYYRHQEVDSYIDERDGKKYPRIRPIPIGKQVPMSEFIENIGMLMDHMTHSDAYLYNSRAIYNHPAGKEGFYQQLGEFAEQLKGIDIDEILMLPDGQFVLETYQLYEKYLKEDFASLDWRHRSDQFQKQIERVNSKLEEQMKKQIQNYYPELNEMRVRKIVNSAIGISRGITLSEPETSAYADSIDADGKGMVASFSTNDAASLNVFNSLHNALRWQGEHNWNLMYFMPVEGKRGMWWKHEEAKENMAKFMDSLIAGHGRGDLPELFVDILTNINKVGGPQGMRKGWRNDYAFDGHFVYKFDKEGNKTNTINAFETFKAMEAIGYEGVSSFIEVNRPGTEFLKATNGDLAEERKIFFRYIFKRYIYEGDNFQESDLDNYLAKLRVKGEEKTLGKIKKNNGTTSIGTESIINGSWEEQVTYATSQLFMESTLAHYTAAKMPSLLLKIGRNRFTENGISRYEQAFRHFRNKEKWSLELFDLTMKDFGFAEMLLRRQISQIIREEMSYNRDFSLDQIDKIDDLKDKYRLNEKIIRDLLSKNSKGEDKLKSPEEIERAVKLWKYMKESFFTEDTEGKAFLDETAFEEIKEYPFTIGLEETDMSLVAYRGTGPRMVARAIKDIASIEQTCTPWLMNMPNIMNEVAVNGKHDFGPLIEYLLKAKKAINDVHGSEAAHEFVYKVSGGVINYFKRDGMAKPLFGLLRLGRINSNAGEYASSSYAVWEWDSRNIDRWCIALQSYNLLPGKPYDKSKTEINPKTGKVEHVGGKLEDRWIKLPFLKNPIKFGKKRHVDFVHNIERLRREHGADRKAITWDMVNQFLPLTLAFLLWKYIKDAMDEVSGKKK